MKQQREGDEREVPVQEDIAAQQVEWYTQRWGTVLLFAIVILALLGGFSDGWLSATSRSSADGRLTLEYERMARAVSDTRYVLRVNAAPGQPATVTLRGDFMDNVELDKLAPLALRASGSTHSLTLHLPATADGKHAVWMTGQPQSAGYFTSTVTLVDGAGITFSQWVWP